MQNSIIEFLRDAKPVQNWKQKVEYRKNEKSISMNLDTYMRLKGWGAKVENSIPMMFQVAKKLIQTPQIMKLNLPKCKILGIWIIHLITPAGLSPNQYCQEEWADKQIISIVIVLVIVEVAMVSKELGIILFCRIWICNEIINIFRFLFIIL